MNLGFILFDYFPFGGLQRDCLKAAALCAQRGHAVTIFTRTWQGSRPKQIAVQLFGRRGITNVARNRNFIAQLATELPRHALDGVIGFNRVPGLDVYYGADPCFAVRSRQASFPLRWLPRHRHYLAAEATVFGQGMRTLILLLTDHEIPVYQQHYGTEAGRFHVLPPGIPQRAFTEELRADTRKRIRAAHNWPVDDQILLFVGSGFRVKGLDRAISALAALPGEILAHNRLVVIGRNPPGRFARLAHRLGVLERVRFLGGRDDVPDWQLAADIQLHPAYSESAGMVLLEALTAGLPVLTTDTCGYAFHIEKARAGIVLKSPFSQDHCNAALVEMFKATTRADWHANGLAYAAREDLYSCHQRAVEIIEATVRDKIERGLQAR